MNESPLNNPIITKKLLISTKNAPVAFGLAVDGACQNQDTDGMRKIQPPPGRGKGSK
jgi:hypothetical protein